MSPKVTRYDAIARTADRIGLFALFAFACLQMTKEVDSLCLLLVMLLCIVVDIRRLGAAMARSTVARLTLVIGLYVVLWTVVSSWRQPQLAHANFDRLPDWLTLLLFPLIAWFTRGQTKRVLTVLALALVGILLGIAQSSNWHEIAQAWAHASVRAHWGGSFVVRAFALGTALLGWIILAKRIVGRGRWQPLRVVGWLLVAAVLSEMLFLTQSRNIILSLLLLLPMVTVVSIRRLVKSGHRKQAFGFGLLVLVGAITLSAGNFGRIAHRYQETESTLNHIATVHKIPETSLGIRLKLYMFGSKLWLERPILGWGPGYEATKMNENAPPIARNFTHLHNGYLVVLVRFGMVGLLLCGALAFYFGRDFFRAWRDGDVEPDIGLFLVSATAMGGMMNVVTSQLVHTRYAFLHILLLGLTFGYVLAHESNRPRAARGLGGPSVQKANP
ncbi:MAG: O-antigen ligase family protein [Salinisphaera sp.]|uniref:O-antigen ligase family protein n=1 Tax=Salinisphaera sp. TaxID=1914330 RepID=UPI003C7A8C5C